MVAFENIRILEHLLRKFFNVALMTYGNANERGDIFTNLLRVEESVISLDNTAGFELLNPLHYRRCRQLHIFCYIRQARTSAILENIKDF